MMHTDILVYAEQQKSGAVTMSGGHFDYKQAYLGYIADQLERDIAYNAIPYDAAIVKDGEKYHGYQLQPQTVELMSDVVEQLRRLENILREYDLAVSGDSCEATFQERVGITPIAA